MSTTELIGAVEAAGILGLSRPGIHKRVRDGRLEPFAVIGQRRTYVFDRATIEAIAQQEKESANG